MLSLSWLRTVMIYKVLQYKINFFSRECFLVLNLTKVFFTINVFFRHFIFSCVVDTLIEVNFLSICINLMSK